MPSRHTLKSDVAESFYHIFARGASKQPIFLESSDYLYFIALFERYLSNRPRLSRFGVPYPHYAPQLELLCYCLMPNHFHLLIYQQETGTMTKLMRSLMTSYSRYFNTKYKRTGSLFETRYKAAQIDAQAHLEHISRYIHLNPRFWQRYDYSSLQYYQSGNEPEWLKSGKVLELFSSHQDYATFLKDYEGHRNMLDEIKKEMADL